MQSVQTSTITIEENNITSLFQSQILSSIVASSVPVLDVTPAKKIIKIKLFALDISQLVLKGRLNPYTVTLENLWQRNSKKNYKTALKRLQLQSYDQKFIDAMNLIMTKMKNANVINETIDDEDTDIVKKINQITLDINSISDLQTTSEYNLETLKQMAIKQIKEKIHTSRGNKHEKSVIDDYEEKNDVVVSDRTTNKYSKTINLDYDLNTTIELTITGRIDGIDKINNIIIEAKKRQYKLSYKLRDYENLQAQTYMWLSNIHHTHLTETFNNKSKMYDIYYNQRQWENYFLPTVIDSVYELVEIILNTELQDKLLTINKDLTK
jgi:hypothetical protein